MERVFRLVMAKLMLANKGFTLIETLFVLFIICILSTLSMSLHIPQKNIQQNLQEICSFLNQAKMEAMVSKQTVKIIFSHDSISYSNLSCNQTYQLADGTFFDEYTFTFNGNGNIKTAKTLLYHTPEKSYRFVYQVGSGCFYVE